MRSSRLLLRLLALAISLSLFVLVRGERRVVVSYVVPSQLQLPEGLEPATPLPAEVTISISGPWGRLRSLDADAMGPVRIDLSRARAGPATWFARPETLHVPHLVRVDSVFPAQGTVELRARGPAGSGREPRRPRPARGHRRRESPVPEGDPDGRDLHEDDQEHAGRPSPGAPRQGGHHPSGAAA